MKLFGLRLGIGTKTLAALSLVFWIPVSALALLLSQLFEGVVQDEVTARTEVHFKGAYSLYEKRSAVLENLLAQMAARRDIRQAVAGSDSSRLQTDLLEFGKQNTFVSLLAVVDASQHVISRRNGLRGDVLTLGSLVPDALRTGKPVSATELISRDLLIREDEELTNTVRDPALARLVVAPVKEGDEVVGALVGGILLSADSWLGNAVHHRFGVELAMFAGNPREPFLLHATTSLPRSIWTWGQRMPTPITDEVQKGRRFSGLLNIGEHPVSAVFAPIKDSRDRIVGALGVGTPIQAATGVVNENIVTAIGVTALIGLVVALVSVFFVQHDMTRPLRVLSNAMERFGEGDLTTRVNLRTGDQLEDLGHGFNAMAEGICRREERFTKHNEVSKLFMSTMDMDQLLDQTLQIVVGVTESQLGVLYLCDHEQQTLVPRAQYGTTARLSDLTEGDGYPGRAAKDGTTLRLQPSDSVQTVSIDLGFLQAMPSEVVYIPLVSQEATLGVLVLGSVRPYRDDDIQMFDYLADQISIALENALMHKRIHELSITDGLTGLYNRRFLNSRLEQEWARSSRHNTPLSVLLADIDDFKAVNDTYGHDCGDEVLKKVACIFRATARQEDLTARYGGEEFVFLLANTDSEGARRTAERIAEGVRSLHLSWSDRPVTLSIGIATFPEHTFANHEELLLAADKAMYRAKHAGKDRYEVYGSYTDTEGGQSSTG